MVKLGNEVVAANQQSANVMTAKAKTVNGNSSSQGGLVCKKTYKSTEEKNQHLRDGDLMAGDKWIGKDGKEREVVTVWYDEHGRITGYQYQDPNGKIRTVYR